MSATPPARPSRPAMLSAARPERFFGPERLLLAGLLGLVCCLYSLLARDTYAQDFRAYYVAALVSHAGMDPYYNQINVDEKYADRDWLEVSSRFIYPPSSLMLFAPLSHLPYRVAKVAFGTSAAVLMACVLWFLAGKFPHVPWLPLGLFLSLPMASNVDNGQVDGLILALGLTAFYARRSWLGGIALGVAIAIKLSPVLLLVWLVTNRRWSTALWAIVTGVALTAASVAIWGVGLYREFFDHLRHHLAANPPMLQHVFRTFSVIYGRFVVIGTSSYSLHYFYGVRQNPLRVFGSAVGIAGLLCVAAYVAWTRLTRAGRGLDDEASFFGFLVVALLANPLLWPAGLVACFPLTLLLANRARNGLRWGMLMLLPFFAPIEFIADRRFLFWLAAAGACLWTMRSGKSETSQARPGDVLSPAIVAAE